ncbi:MAG: NlpC/P60 family protein, partial [Pseudomonadota bacterium]
EGEFGLVQLHRDRYVGWVLMEAVSAPVLEVTHRVSALRSYVHSEPDLKSAPRFLVTLGAPVVAEEQEGEWVGCARAGWIHERHLQPLDALSDDPAGIAVRYLGSPYLWGGRESLGLDCTGLTVASFGACGVTLPRDSDMQFAWAGEPIEAWDTPGVLRRGDLVFWKGHVGIMLDEVR